jgi:hypothetical protein
MSNGSSSFSVLAFLLGLAIGLWIAIVALFLVDFDDDNDCCGGGGDTTVMTFPQADTVSIPGGDGGYYCTNNDEGGAIVVDEGGAVVADEGGAVVIDEGGAVIIDEGNAVVADSGGFPPAPGPDQLGRDRLHEEFACDTNDEGGAIVVDSSGRVAVTSMLNSEPSERCIRVNGNAVVINDMSVPVHADEGGAVVIDEGGTVVADEGGAAVADAGDDASLGTGAPTSDTPLAYCMVATPTSTPIVIRP